MYQRFSEIIDQLAIFSLSRSRVDATFATSMLLTGSPLGLYTELSS